MVNKSKGAEFVEAPNNFTLYILRGSKNHLYIGITSNLNKRIQRHKSGDGAEFTFRNRIYDLAYTESFATLIQARRRESQTKGWRREKKENLMQFGKPII